MEEFFTRTSVSIDEAVGILIGWLRGPFDAEVYIDEYKKETESSVFDLAETLSDEGEFLESEYAEAHHDESPPEVIAQKLEALKSHRTRCDKAKKYLCDIKDELNKGDSSALRIDKECPYAMRHITLSSLNEWSTTKYSIDILTPGRLPVSIQESPSKDLVIENQTDKNNIKHEEERDAKGGLGKTKADNLYTTFAFLVEHFYTTALPKYRKGDGAPNVTEIAKFLEGLSKTSDKADPMAGQGYEAIENRITEALRVKKGKLKRG